MKVEKVGHVDVGYAELVVLRVVGMRVALRAVVDLDALHFKLVPIMLVLSIESRV